MSTVTLDNFEEHYISVRRKENRVYADEVVRWLPEIDPSHPHYHEWELRKRSSDRLIQHLAAKKTELSILEIGCGNGWLCSQLSKIPGSNVAGTDINLTELSQAKRVFGHVENLEFFNGGISQETINGEEFDIIVFAASIQYFRSFEEIVSKALRLLEPTGEIHILDSFFYRSSELETARRRTAEYYESIQSPEMTKHYFHRCVDELKPYHHHIFYNPYSFTHRFTKNNSPFHWICIYHA